MLFFFFSNFIISVGLNSSYKKMSTTSDTNLTREVEITEAESTLVNGKIKGKIKYDEEQMLATDQATLESLQADKEEFDKRCEEIRQQNARMEKERTAVLEK